jgi:hypothetical protein
LTASRSAAAAERRAGGAKDTRTPSPHGTAATKEFPVFADNLYKVATIPKAPEKLVF